MSEFDLVVRGGSLVDGSGTPAYTADVAIRGDRVVEVGKVSGRGAQELDADGAVVAPGFVDVHTHYDGQVTWDERLQPSSWHGVTTVVMGNCGVGFAPAVPEDRERLIELMEGVEDIPGVALTEGLPWNWQTFPEFLDSLDGQARDLDFATQVPHAALRVRVMGERAAAHEQATSEEITRMGELAAAAIRAGALGFSTSRTLNHKAVGGELISSYGAGWDELVGIATAIGKTGTGVLQMVTDWEDVDVDMDLIGAMTGGSGRPLSVSVVHGVRFPERHRAIMAGFDRLRAEGHEVTGQVAARGIGLILGHEVTLNPFRNSPSYQKIAHLPMKERIVALRTSEVRANILDEGVVTDAPTVGSRFLDMFEQMFELTDPPNYEPDPNDNIQARALRMGISPEELAYDILLQDDGYGMLYLTFANYVNGSLDGLKELMEHPAILPGLSDGGAHVGTICDGSFPTTLLQHWVRDRERGRLPLEHVVNRQARRTALAVGLKDRGILQPGYRADLNVIDMDGLHLRRPEVHYDLPAGGRRLLQRADGYRHTVVAGAETYRNGEPTGSLPGRLIRGAQADPVRV